MEPTIDDLTNLIRNKNIPFLIPSTNPYAYNSEGTMNPKWDIYTVFSPEHQLNRPTNILKLLVNQTDSHGQTPLQVAYKRNDEFIIKTLLKAVANPETGNIPREGKQQDDAIPLLSDLIYANEPILINKSINPKWQRFFKPFGSDIMETKLLTSIVNRLNSRGQTPLYLASRNGNYETAHYLLSARADINQRNSNGDTPAHGAAFDKFNNPGYSTFWDKHDFLKFLFDSKANLFVENDNRETPISLLHYSSNT